MNQRITETIAFLDANRARLLEVVSAIPEHVRATRPAPDQWSVAEVLAHLAAVERRLGLFLASKIGEARKAGLGPERDNSAIEPTMSVDALTDRTRKLTAGEAVQPPADADASKALADLDKYRERLKALVIESDGLALGDVVAPHPVFGPLNAYQWVFFIAGHEARHTEQIRECGEVFVTRLAEQQTPKPS
jgi:hypothetical protein